MVRKENVVNYGLILQKILQVLLKNVQIDFNIFVAKQWKIQTLRAPADPLELFFEERQGPVGFIDLGGRLLDPWKMVCGFVRLWFMGLFYCRFTSLVVTGSTFGHLENGVWVCDVTVYGPVLLLIYKFSGVGLFEKNVKEVVVKLF